MNALEYLALAEAALLAETRQTTGVWSAIMSIRKARELMVLYGRVAQSDYASAPSQP